MKGAKKVYLSPDGVYHQINLNTLLNPANKKYILESVDIQQVTNLQEIITNPSKVVTSKKDLVLLGFPNYELPAKDRYQVAQKQKQAKQNSEIAIAISPNQVLTSEMIAHDSTRSKIGNLTQTKVEVETIALLAKENQWQPILYLQDEALEETVKAVNNPRILHIATHGFFNANVKEGKEENPLLRSGLLLAGASQTLTGKEQVTVESLSSKDQAEDGVLTAYEVMNLNLDQTDLVVLSACETGLGEVSNGEGVYGLQRAFIVAGAKSLIISLWKVSDLATSKLMTAFYKSYLKTGEKRKSFIKAQKQVKKKYKHPYFWGGFVMIGE
jgi:CHAT domain-containing protein